MSQLQGAHIEIKGIVQGVGFRPFVYELADRFSLTGWVRNTSAGVIIEVDGSETNVVTFIQVLQDQAPPLARIDDFLFTLCQPNGFATFEILRSQRIPEAFQPISPDVSICPDCLSELHNPDDRRFRYPFINCTNCGPRFTIINDIPYDRPNTTMAPFVMCPECAREYENPLDRRFHAQPIACPACGPHIWVEINGEPMWRGDEALAIARRFLKKGKIVAVKGLGGFHLACDATNPDAVAELRWRKMRVDKPFAVMFPDLATVAAHCRVSEVESALLQSRERPIVILQRKKGRILPLYHPVSPEVTPGQDTIGVMLPYTPFHDLFIEPEAGFPYALVMTSGNISEEPIAIDNAEAKARLNELADVYLLHNRDIRTRCDDSVVRVFEKNIYPMRRSRGYAPFPVKLPVKAMPLLAAGAELKNTFCLTREHYAFLSHHIGDLENYESLCSFEDGVQHLERLFRVTPEAIAFDLHPNYMASRYALERSQRENLPLIGVQHHFAHITACMVDNGLSGEEPLLGVSFDGTGYGTDGAIWGGEFLLTDYAGFQRLKHIAYFPLPGGDAAIREPNRVALSLLDYAGIAWSDNLPPVQEVDHETRHILQRQLKTGINTPKTSSMGRLFDAVSSIAGIRQRVNYEAQAAIELEALVDPEERGIYPFDVQGIEIDPKPMVQKLVADCIAGVPVERIAARFHNGIAQMVVDVCLEIRRDSGIQEIALSGGVWQNMTLLEKVMPLLRESNFTVYLHRQIPTNDGGIALGQAMVAVHHLLGTKS